MRPVRATEVHVEDGRGLQRLCPCGRVVPGLDQGELGQFRGTHEVV
jgi:hypothetical protein